MTKKAVKKKNRKLVRTIRKTLGTLFLVSALVVAAIPVDNLRASNEDSGIMPLAAARDEKYSQNNVPCSVPHIPKDAKVYNTENRKLEFVYFQDANGDSQCIITGFAGGYVEGEALEIPNKVSAYRQYNPNDGPTSGFVAVGRQGNFLFYRDTTNVPYILSEAEYNKYNREGWSGLIEAQGPLTNKYVGLVNAERVKDENGNETSSWSVILNEETGNYLPCYMSEDPGERGKEKWQELGRDRIYYYSAFYSDASGNTKEIPTSTADNAEGFDTIESNQSYWRLQNQEVNYISKEKYNSASGEWEEITDEDDGVFANASNIAKVTLGEEFRGVGNYAFCGSGIRSIEFENGLQTIGKGAFKDCRQLQEIDIKSSCPLREIGVSAFEDCRSLGEISLPWSTETIGNAAFKGCDALTKIDLCNEGEDAGSSSGVNNLRNIGFDVFENCKALESLTFPDTCAGPIYMSTFAGCSSLKYICSRNEHMTFPEDSIVSYEQFKKMLDETNERVKGEFYFEGLEGSDLHEMCRENCFAFSYIWDRVGSFAKKDRYELTMPAMVEAEGTNTFVVTSANNLFSYDGSSTVKTLTFPEKIGPHRIETLNPEVMKDRCNLETIIIPNTVKEIGERTFQGCHNLTNVLFDSYNLENGDDVTIGKDAFRTQNCATHVAGYCDGTIAADKEDSLLPGKKLSFTGPISLDFGAYTYAMSEDGTYNFGNQTTSYITYYSGWPGNLEIQYNPKTGLSELVNYPSLSELVTYDSSKYKYLELTGTDYVDAMQTAYTTYIDTPDRMSPNQKAVVNAVLDLVIPAGVQSVKEGLIWDKSQNNDDPTKTVTAYSLVTVKAGEEYIDDEGNKRHAGTFSGCDKLTGIFLREASDKNGTESGTTAIEAHAFLGCEKLVDVELSKTITEIGNCPFYGCKNVSSINFRDNPNFDCEQSIIYGLDADRNKVKVVECLEGRSSRYVEKDELEGVKELAEEAFRGTNVSSVDLTGTTITTVPVRAFAETTNLSRVSLPKSLENLAFQDYAFDGSTVDYFIVESPSSTMRSSDKAFTGLMKADGDPRPEAENDAVQWYAIEGSQAEAIGDSWGFNTKPYEGVISYNVTFTYWDNDAQEYVSVDAPEKVASNNMSALEEMYPVEVGTVVEMEGDKYRLTEWKENADAKKSDHLYYDAVYKVLRWVVTFQNYNGALIFTVEVPDEGSVPEQKRPVPGADFQGPEGRTFIGWVVDGDLGYITSDLTAVADFSVDGEYLVEYYARRGSITAEWECFYSTTLKAGATAPELTPPSDWSIEGYKFTGWDKALTNINEYTKFYANYEPENGNGGGDNPVPSNQFTLTVIGGSGGGTYPAGAQVVIQADAPAEGQEFSDWSVSPADTVISDRTRSSTIITMPSSDVAVIANYRNRGNNGDGNNGGGTGSGNDGNNGGGNGNQGTGNLHTLTVKGGSGSGSYAAGQQIIVTADTPPRGQEFSSWTVSPASTVVTDKSLSSMAITMPDYDVAVIANYKARSYSSSGSGAGTNRPTNTAQNVGGSSVVIDKNGLSNTGVVSATVNGSSDNFVVKVTESSSATEAVLRALLAEYGNVDNIKYFPMDISLYDSTGTRKITDTTGLSVSITLPLPDSLITYAGNNKVAGVVNDRLDKLSPKFTTINGVACVTFTAEHFSPYVIYVDITNLSDGTIADRTPTTGDGIHPKWFLSIGLASLSFVMFMWKDSRKGARRKQKVPVRARR